jgi:hypothetical protein
VRLTNAEFVEWVAYNKLENETPEQQQADDPMILLSQVQMAIRGG